MSTSLRRSRSRATGVAFACPNCQTLIGTVDRCPNCQFTGADTMNLFEGATPTVAPVNDTAKIWDESDLKAIAQARKRAANRFPQFRWSFCTVNLPLEANLRLFGFWMLNVCPIRADESETDRLWTVLLLINAGANKTAVIPAYAAEPWLGNDQWDKALASMATPWKNGYYGKAVADFVDASLVLLEASWERAATTSTAPARRPMKRSLLSGLLVWVLPLAPGLASGAAPDRPPSAEPPAADTGSPFEFGTRPPQPVFDLTGTLAPATVAEISSDLAAVHSHEGIDVIVVLLKDLNGAPPEHVAKRFADAWCSRLFHCVVLHVPGDKNGPWIVPGGKLLRHFSEESVRIQVADACRRASLEPKEEQKVRSAATEASDMLRIWVGDGSYFANRYNAKLEERRDDLQNRDRLRKILIPTAAGTLVVLIGLAVYIVRWFNNRRPRLFPEPRWQRRLGAPYAGGNDASLRLTRPTTNTPTPPDTP